MVKIRKQFSWFPALGWAAGLDALDIVNNAVQGIITAVTGGVALPAMITLDLAVDAVQGLAAFIIFDEPKVWAVGTGLDALMPSGFDLLPSYSAMVVAIDKKWF